MLKHAAITFLQLIYPGGPWCLSAATPERDKLTTRTFTDEMAALKWIKSWNGERNIYYHVNPPRDENAAQKLKRTDVAAVHYFQVDVDPSDLGEKSPEDFRKVAFALIKSPPKPLPPPTVIVYSGAGFQATWQLSDPIELDGTLPMAESAKLYNVEIERIFKEAGGPLCKTDNCHNIDRLLRLPGTLNVPSELKIKRGRSPDPVEAKLVSYEAANAYPLSAFSTASPATKPASAVSGQAAPQATSGAGNEPPITHLAELDKWQIPTRVKTVIAMGRDADKPKKGDDSRSAWLYDAISNLIRHAVPDAVIYGIITDARWKIAESVLDKKDPDGYARRQIEKAHGSAKTGEHAKNGAQPPSGNGPPPSGGGHHGGSGNDFQLDKNGIPYPSQYNVRHALGRLGARLRYDLFADRMELLGVPGHGPVLQDSGITYLYLTIDDQFKFRVGKDLFWMIVENEARRNSYHPVRDYLDALTWDGKPRVEEWLITHGGAADTPYVRAVTKLMMVAGVRRVREPGALFQEMLVLITPEQGKGKSTAIKALCPDGSWFTDDLPLGADSKTIMERLAGKWIVEAAELKGLRNSDVEHLKAFLSRLAETARMAWGRIAKESPRQCIIFGTTNAIRFLRDTTGNRRFWPIQLTREMTKEAIQSIRDQLWAEACVMEASWQGDVRLARELWDQAGEAQESVRLDDPYYDILNEYLGDKEGKIASNDVWTILGIGASQRSTQSQQMGEAMRLLQWKRKNMRFGGKSVEAGYVKGEGLRRIEVWRDPSGKVHVDYESGRHDERSF